MTVEKHITIEDEQAEFIDDMNLSISGVTQDALDDQIEEFGWEPPASADEDDVDADE